MPDIVISEFMDEAAVREGLAGFDVVYDPTLVDRPNELITLVESARALIVRNRTQVRDRLLEAATRLRVVGRLGVGLDNIDLLSCERRQISVYPATGANDRSVAEYVICAAMMLLRGAYASTSRVAAGEWPREALIGREMGGKVLGLVGFGSIAKQTAMLARAMGMHVIAYDPYTDDLQFSTANVEKRQLPALLGEADVVSLHVPLTKETENLIDGAALQLMKPNGILINAARGGVVDEAAVVQALIAGKLGGAALDVFAKEPLGPGAGSILENVPNLILTPHIAGVTDESNVRVSWVTVTNVKKALDA